MNRLRPDYTIVSSVQHTLGEGPIWDHRSGSFLWVDAYSHCYYSADVSEAGITEPVRHDTGFFTIGITLWGDAPENYLLAGDDALYLWESGAYTRIAGAPFSLIPGGPETHRFNDVIAGPDGTYYAGMMGRGSGADRPTGALLRLRARAEAEVVMTAVRLPNGMGFSPDRRWFYFTDSLARRIYRFPWGGEDLGVPEVWAETTGRPGVPDGMTVAADGSVLSARWGGACIDRYAPDGTLEAQYEVPMSQPSSVCFGGPGLGTLLVTSATEGMGRGDNPNSGAHPVAIPPTEGITIALDIGLAGLPEYTINPVF